MTIHVKSDTTIAEINKQFQKHFPFLKLQFYENFVDRKANKEVAGDAIKNQNTCIHDIVHAEVDFEISMAGQQHVETFEKHWFELGGLWVQVFRKSGPIWLQTTVTDDMTLAGVNEFGVEMNKSIEKSKPQEDHYHEQK